MASNPLNSEQKRRLQFSRKKVMEMLERLESCKRCGMDVSDREQYALHLLQKLDLVNKEFVGVNPQSQAIS